MTFLNKKLLVHYIDINKNVDEYMFLNYFEYLMLRFKNCMNIYCKIFILPRNY